MDRGNYSPSHYPAILRHLDKQHQVLMDAYRLMMHESQKLQVEEQILLRKLYDIVSAQDLVKKNDVSTNAAYDGEGQDSNKEDSDEKEEQ